MVNGVDRHLDNQHILYTGVVKKYCRSDIDCRIMPRRMA